ncbi:Oidioi.mRNA.OKI2018_I69.XSR.g15161.t1.cds [Oikopleura dioica]|uniref:Oidioi.mRNA.OKI2018_I69.XSR.g15161.t1.cds n=1 Tax=Oikopleura dioica TaxID=34765 RepID=A0ABN7SFY7_OIKDI|nr:Oidioi.mRNA.OKI2018_I69.XSR.g15161.t1.cds [Oikopleura dioica]
MFRFLNVQVCRGLFLLILTTIVFYTFTERPTVENIPQSGAENGLSASVPRRGAPPPPPSDARDCTFDLPKNLIIHPIRDELEGLLLNLFYRIGLYEDAQFLLPKTVSDFNEAEESDLRIIFCFESCSFLFNSDVIPRFTVTALSNPLLSSTSSSTPNPIAKAFDFDPSNTDEGYIQSVVVILKSRLDFVIIREHLLESLIYLRHKLCLDWEDVLNLDKVPLLKSLKTQEVEQTNTLDWRIYNYFNETLWDLLDSEIRDLEKERDAFLFHLNRMNSVCSNLALASSSDKDFCDELSLTGENILRLLTN